MTYNTVAREDDPSQFMNNLKSSLPEILRDCNTFIQICSKPHSGEDDNFIKSFKEFITVCLSLKNVLDPITMASQSEFFSALLECRKYNKSPIRLSMAEKIDNSENFITELFESCDRLYDCIENIDTILAFELMDNLPDMLSIVYKVKGILHMLLNSCNSTFNSFMLKVDDSK